MLIFPEVVERLKNLDEVTLLELLDISSEDIVARFEDFIENRFDYLEVVVRYEQDD